MKIVGIHAFLMVNIPKMSLIDRCMQASLLKTYPDQHISREIEKSKRKQKFFFVITLTYFLHSLSILIRYDVEHVNYVVGRPNHR